MQNIRFKEFVDYAADQFEHGSIDAIPQDLPVNYFPVIFSPYLRQEAITDTMIDTGLQAHANSGVRLMVFYALKFAIENCESKENQRKQLAYRLNNPIH